MNSIYAIFFDPKNHPGLISYLNKKYYPIYTKDSRCGREEWIEYSNDGKTVDWRNSHGDTCKYIYDSKNRLIYKRTVFNSGTSRTRLKKLNNGDYHFYKLDDRFVYHTEHEITEEVYVYDNDGNLKSSEITTTTKTFDRYMED